MSCESRYFSICKLHQYEIYTLNSLASRRERKICSPTFSYFTINRYIYIYILLKFHFVHLLFDTVDAAAAAITVSQMQTDFLQTEGRIWF